MFLCKPVLKIATLSSKFENNLMHNTDKAFMPDMNSKSPHQPAHIQSNFSGLNIFGSVEICSRYGKFEPLGVSHGTRSGSK